MVIFNRGYPKQPFIAPVPSASANATVTATSFEAVATFPAATVTVTATPASFEAVATFPAATVTVTATPASFEGVATFPAAAVAASSTITATVFEGVATFPSLTVTVTNGSPDPPKFKPGPAWLNQFGALARSGKTAVLYDTAPPPQAGIYVVQSKLVTGSNSGSLNVAATAGNALFVAYAGTAGAGSNNTVNVTGMTFGGVALSKQIEQDDPNTAGSGSSGCSAIWMLGNVAAGQTAVVVTGNANLVAADAYFVIYEVAGLGAYPTLDQSQAGPLKAGTPSWTSNSGAGSPTTTNAAEFWIGVTAHGPNGGAEVLTGPASPWINQSQANWGDGASIAGAQVTTSTGTLVYSGASGASNDYYTCVVASFYPGSSAPVIVPAATSPAAINPSDAWQNQFGPLAHTSKRAVFFDQQSSVTLYETAFEAIAVILDGLNGATISGGATVAATAFEAVATFPAFTVTVTNGSPDPSEFSPSPAWQNQFGPFSHVGKFPVLYDVQSSCVVYAVAFEGIAEFPASSVSAAASIAPAVFEAIAAFPAAVVTVTNGSPDPPEFSPSDAWLNQFGPLSHTLKRAVLYDTQSSTVVYATVFEAVAAFPAVTVTGGAAVSATVFEAVATFPAVTVTVGAAAANDPQSALPGPAWLNQFGPFAHTGKIAVLFDTQSSTVVYATPFEGIAEFPASIVSGGATVAASAFEAVATFPAVTVTVTNGSPDPQAALPGPAWLNQFGPFARSVKSAVLYDTQSSAVVYAVPGEAIAFILDGLNGAVISGGATVSATVLEGIATFPAPTVTTTTVTADPQGALPGPAWLNQFGPFAHTGKIAVLFDTQSSTVVYAPVLEGVANFPALTIAGGATVTSSVLEAVANFPAFTVVTSNLSPDPSSAIFSPAWQNQFGPFSHTAKFSVLYDTQSSAVVYAVPLEAVASFPAATVTAAATIAAVVLECIATFPAFTVKATNQSPDPAAAFPGPAWQNRFHGAFGKLAVQYDTAPGPFVAFGPFCFVGTEADTNLYGGTSTDANAGLGGTATDFYVGLGGTETDTNPYTGAGVLGYGGTETDTNPDGSSYGGTFTDANLYGGSLYNGCFN